MHKQKINNFLYGFVKFMEVIKFNSKLKRKFFFKLFFSSLTSDPKLLKTTYNTCKRQPREKQHNLLPDGSVGAYQAIRLTNLCHLR